MTKYFIELIAAQIKVALKQEYERGWDDCMNYHWKKTDEEYNEEKDPYSG
tara:strand:- start:290 stop:439 length:150 start_codon:yes stop_codon:yes gene_type:complete